MMNYVNGYGYNPYLQPHPSYFANTLQQTYANQPQQQVQTQQPTQTQQTITTQPPIMQPQAMVSKITQVLNKEEATGSPVDLINGVPSFFYNKSNGEIYLKQFDVPSGTAIFKTYVQIQEKEENLSNIPEQNANYEKELQYISQGIDNLYQMLIKMQHEGIIEDDIIDVDPEPIEEKRYKNKKRGQ